MSEERKSGFGRKLFVLAIVLALLAAFAGMVKVFPCPACEGKADESQRMAVKRPENCMRCASGGKVTLYTKIVNR